MADYLSYFDAKKPASFSGAYAFQKVVKKPKKWLQTQETYTLHKPVQKNFKRRRTLVPSAGYQFQADLIDFSLLKNFNSNFRYILVLIDVFSKVAYAHCLKNKNSKDIIDAFRVLLPKTGSFQKLQTDKGKEFLNKPFQAWLKKQNITHFTTSNYDTKASIVERFIRTLKQKLWRYFTYKNTRKYTDILQDLVHSYNHSYHSSIKCKPIEVNKENQEFVWQNLYGDLETKEPKLKIGDTVRLAVTRARFTKSYLPGWTDELFVVTQTFSDDPPYYKIKDLQDQPIEGTFYEQELQKVFINSDIYKIENILKSRKRKSQREYLVKWVGFPESFNSWVKQKDMVNNG